MQRHVVVGIFVGLLFGLSVTWFWAALPNGDFLQLVGAVTYPELAAGIDRNELLIRGIVFLLMFSVFAAVIGSMDIDNMDGSLPIILTAYFLGSIYVFFVFKVYFEYLGAFLSVIFGVLGAFFGYVGVTPGLYIGAALNKYVVGDGVPKAAPISVVTVLIYGLIVVGLVVAQRTLNPPTRAEQIAQLQTQIASTAIANVEMTQLAVLAATLNQPIPTAAPTNPAPPNLLSNQLATLMAQNAQNPQSNTNSGQSSQPIDLDQISLIAGLMASIVTVVGGVYAGYRVLRGKK